MKDKDIKKGDFSKGSISKTIINMAVPITLAELVHVLYNVIDRVFIGHIPLVGTAALSGVGIAFPMVTFITAFANLCGMGGNPLCSMARGAGDLEKAKRIMETAFTLLIAIGLAITVIMYFAAEPVLSLLGGDEETLPYALDYFRVYVLGTVFVLISLGMNPFINGMGFTKIGMGTVIIGAVLNIILDYVFIFLLDMGVKGAAVATVISQFVSALWVVAFLTGKRTIIRIEKIRLDRTEAKRIVKLGVTGFTFKFSNSITQAVVNMTLKQFGGTVSTIYIGAMSIINSVREVVSQPALGIGSAAIPVMSFNKGAGNSLRVKQSISFLTKSLLVYNFAVWAFMMIAPQLLIGLFTPDDSLVETAVSCAHIYYMAYFMMTLQICGQNTFVALNMPKYGLFFSLLRKIILVLPLTLILPRIGLGVMGVFYAEMISQIIGASLCYFTMYKRVYKKL